MTHVPPTASERRPARTRREFLAHATFAASAVSLLGSSKSAGATAPIIKARPRAALRKNDPIRIGVIGVGGPGGCAMGLNHCLAFASINNRGTEQVQVAAICDVNQRFLEGARNAIAGTQTASVETYTRYQDLLAREDLHGVLAAVPEHWHAKVGIDTIHAGKDLYLEKPMTLNLADALALYDVARSNPEVIAQVGTQKTRLPKYLEARKLIRDGVIGTPTSSQTSYCRNVPSGEWHYTIDPEWKPGVNLDWDTWCGPLGAMAWDPQVYYQWRRYRTTSTGIVGDLLVHEMTPMLMALEQGWPVRVVATGGHHVDKAMENHDNVNIAVQFETGHQMLVTGSTCNEMGLETLIRGHKGNIFLASRHCEVRPERPFTDEIEPTRIECPDIGDDQDQHRIGWLRGIRTREPAESSVELGLKVMVIVDLATRSMWEGRAFTFDPATMTSKAV